MTQPKRRAVFMNTTKVSQWILSHFENEILDPDLANLHAMDLMDRPSNRNLVPLSGRRDDDDLDIECPDAPSISYTSASGSLIDLKTALRTKIMGQPSLKKACKAAIEGKALPAALGNRVLRLCVIRGIRYHRGFAADISSPLWPAALRALNARKIMSGIVPDMASPSSMPYCFWYPYNPSEETCRKLASRYPEMRYLVGRACAVGGYETLFEELQLLPEVSIAEEARAAGSMRIYDSIMSSPSKYAVLNDYLRTVHAPEPATLNGDTCIRTMLNLKQEFEVGATPYELRYFDITEDMCIDLYSSRITTLPFTEQMSHLLYSPLPADLPDVNKDLLILMAAYYGNIERYTRLRRPTLSQEYRKCTLTGETACIVRGIYHNPMFAKWWDMQDLNAVSRCIETAILARFVMSNDLSRITRPNLDCQAPYCIWYPALAHKKPYEKLAQLRPDMKTQCAHACIVADYQDSFDRIDAEPDGVLYAETRQSRNTHYADKLVAKAKKKEVELNERHAGPGDEWKLYFLADTLHEPSSWDLYQDWNDVHMLLPWTIYGPDGPDASNVELNVCVPSELKLAQQDESPGSSILESEQD